MNRLQQFYERLRSGRASEDELEAMDRRAFLFGMTATATGLIVAPTVILPAVRPMVIGFDGPCPWTGTGGYGTPVAYRNGWGWFSEVQAVRRSR